MKTSLRDMIMKELLPRIEKLGFVVASSESSDVFDNAIVVIDSPNIRVRVIREKSLLSADFASPVEPNHWFDSAVVIDFVGLSSNGGFMNRDAHYVLEGVGNFLNSFYNELSRAFSFDAFFHTKMQLIALRKSRADRLFGSPGG